MKKDSNVIRTLVLTIILVFAVMSIAMAGAVIKRDRGGNSDRGSRDNGRSVERRDQNQDNRERDRNRDNGGSERDRSDRGDRGNSDRRNSDRSNDRSYDRDQRDHRQPDATPSQPRNYDRHDDNHGDRNGWDHGRNRVDDRQFRRNDERPGQYSRDTYRHHPPVSHRAPVFRGGFYHYYSDDPFFFDYAFHYGHWEFGYLAGRSCRSIYFYYDYFPYIPYADVIVINRPVVTYVEVPVVVGHTYSGSGYYLDNRDYGLDGVLTDIRVAWEQNNPDLLMRHTMNDIRIDVILDRGYAYSVNATDYDAMTRDAINNTETIDFKFDAVKSRGDDRMVAYGRHTFNSLDGGMKTIYISYELIRRDGQWVIDQVGSSMNPLD